MQSAWIILKAFPLPWSVEKPSSTKLVSKRLGTYDFKTYIYSVRWKKNKVQRCQSNSKIYKSVTQSGSGEKPSSPNPQAVLGIFTVCDVKAAAVAVDRGICYNRVKCRPRKREFPLTPVTWAVANIIIMKATRPPWGAEISCRPCHKVSSDI